MNTTTDNQYLQIQREQLRVTDVLNLLLKIYRNCKHSYGKVLTTDYLKEKSLPNQLTQVIVDKNLVKVKGVAAGKMFLWVGAMPTEDMAEEVWKESVKVRNEYEQTKLRERRGESPNRLQIGTKNFVKLLKSTINTPESILKKQPTSITEVKILKMLKSIQSALTTGQHVMDFAGLCLNKGISTKWEKSMLKTVVTTTEHGFEWIGPKEIEYDTVRQVIDCSKTITDIELEILTPVIKKEEIKNEEIKSDFERVNEKLIATIAKSENSSSDNKRMLIIFELLHSLYNNEINSGISNISSYCVKYKLTNNFGSILISEKIVKKVDGVYKWIAEAPTKQMIEQINLAYKQKTQEYYENKKKKNIQTSEVPVITKEIVQGMSGAIETKPKTVLSTIIQEVKQEKESEYNRLQILAAKFAKLKNYDMAEQLLDQALQLK